MESRDVTEYKVAVLAGGWSDEREISLSSGEACQRALKQAGFSDVDLLDIASDDFFSQISTGGYDVAFPALHGRYGEDGCIQGLLEILHLPYAFSGVLASAMGTAKDVAKQMYDTVGIPMPDGVALDSNVAMDMAQANELVERLGLPLFVKPASNGSSYGITKVTDSAELPQAVATAGAKGGKVLVEHGVEGMEITVPVLGNENPQALPIVEIVTNAEFYDLKVKYEPASMHHVIPARLDQDVYDRAQMLAVEAHKVLGCRGVSRSDFIVTEDGTPYILETNTIPGMTETSLLPDSARHAGIEFPELCKRVIELALEDRD